jgi:hypothetical protein
MYPKKENPLNLDVHENTREELESTEYDLGGSAKIIQLSLDKSLFASRNFVSDDVEIGAHGQ